MSQQRKSQTLDRRAPVRHATATRTSASGPGDRIASSRDVAIFFREDCRTLDDSLQLEMVVAQYCLRIRDVRSSSGTAVGEVVGREVVADLEGHGDDLSHAILRGLEHIGAGAIAERAAEAAERLGERGIGLPEKFGGVGAAQPVGAWRSQTDEYDQYALFAEFEHSCGRRHSLMFFVDPRPGVKHLGLLGPMTDMDVDPGDMFHPDTMESLDPPAAGALMREALTSSFGLAGERTDDFRVLISLARATTLERPAIM